MPAISTYDPAGLGIDYPPPFRNEGHAVLPVYGITVTDRKLDEECRLLGNATVASPAHLWRLIRSHETFNGKRSYKDIASLYEGLARRIRGREPDSFLLVRFKISQFTNHWISDTWYEYPEARAKVVLDLLTVGLIRTRVYENMAKPNTLLLTSGPEPVVAERNRSVAAIPRRVGPLHFIDESPFERYVTIASPPMVCSRKEIKRTLRYGRAHAIARPVLTDFAGSFRKHSFPIKGGLHALAEGFRTGSAEQRIFNVATLCDILLGEDSDFAGIERRLRTLLTADYFDRLRFDEIIRARHDFVHRGSDAERDLGILALHGGFVALATYCELATRFSTRRDLSRYLDLLAETSKQHTLTPLVRARDVIGTLHERYADKPILVNATEYYDVKTEGLERVEWHIPE